MSEPVAEGQREVCATHQIRLVKNEQSGKMDCPVCEQVANQSMMSRRSRRR
jgi:predicted RNA-binding Zn-ribbon protein involved in translation (DUF1610 family)